MFYIHSGDKLFPKYVHRVFIHFQGDTEPCTYDMNGDEREAILKCKDRFYKFGDVYANLEVAKEITFCTYVWVRTKEDRYDWAYLDHRLLNRLLSDEGQEILFKREMNVPN